MNRRWSQLLFVLTSCVPALGHAEHDITSKEMVETSAKSKLVDRLSDGLRISQNDIGPNNVPPNIYDALPPRREVQIIDERPIGPFRKAFRTDQKNPGAITAPQRQTLERNDALLYDAVPAPEVTARDPVKLKCFLPPVAAPMPYGTGPGLTPKQQQEFERRWKAEHTLSNWFSKLNKIGSSVHEPIFLNNTVSYIVSFNEKNNVGLLRLNHGGSDGANKEALRIIRAITPFPEPPDNAPYRRGLMFRFTSRRLEIDLAPGRRG